MSGSARFAFVVMGWATIAALVIVLAYATTRALAAAVLAAALSIGWIGRRLLANAANALILRRAGHLRPGHYIRVETGADLEGYVTQVGPRHTRLQTGKGDVVRIPNTTLANSTYTNFHFVPDDGSFVLDVEADETVEPRHMLNLIQEECERAVSMTPGIAAGTLKVTTLPGRFPQCRRFIVKAAAHDKSERDQVRAELGRRIHDRLDREGIAQPRLIVAQHDPRTE